MLKNVEKSLHGLFLRSGVILLSVLKHSLVTSWCRLFRLITLVSNLSMHNFVDWYPYLMSIIKQIWTTLILKCALMLMEILEEGNIFRKTMRF